jgi:uncharacterized repeat protein (TIGR01451 family)
VDLGVGGTSQFGLAGTVHPSARGTLDNTVTATVSAGADPDGSNNAASVSVPIEVVSDLAVAKAGPADAVAGTTIRYEITVTNAGPSDALGITVTDLAPAALEQIQWTCVATSGSDCPAGGTGAPDFTADVLVDGRLDVVVDATIASSFIGDLVNVVRLTPETDATDPSPDDQRAEVVTDVVARADVRVDKQTLTDPVVAGLPVQYAITVVNDGPSDAPLVDLGDTLPAELSGAVWTCSADGGASCPAGGSGEPAITASIPAGDSVTLSIEAALSADAGGDLVNVAAAVVQSPVVDPDTGNNDASVTDPVVSRADVSLALSAPLDPFDPNGPIALPIDVAVSNTGPSTARGIVVTFDTSDAVAPTAPDCTRPLQTRVRCPLPDVGPGETITRTVGFVGLPAPPATLGSQGRVSTAAEDPAAANDTASVSVELRSGIDVDVAIDNGTTWMSPDEVVEYTIRIRNIGSVDAMGADVAVPGDANLLDLDWTCSPTFGALCTPAGSGPIDDVVDLPSGDELTYVLSARVDPDVDLSAPVSVSLSASGAVAAGDVDINDANNIAVDQDDVRLVMFSDGFEAIPPLSPTTNALAPACVDVALPAGAASLRDGRLLEAVSAGGRAMYWLDLRRHNDRRWLQLSVLGTERFETSGWIAWPHATVSVAIEDGLPGPRLMLGREPVWQSSAVAGDAVRLQQGARLNAHGALAPSRCAADAAAAGEGAR